MNTGVGCHFPFQGSSQPRDGSCISCFSCIGRRILFSQLIIFFWLEDNDLQYRGRFCHTSTWISHRCTCVPQILNPTPTSPSTQFLGGCPRALVLGALLHALNLHWSSTLHMVMYVFQCYSLKSSHTYLVPVSSKACCLHLCLLCCQQENSLPLHHLKYG